MAAEIQLQNHKNPMTAELEQPTQPPPTTAHNHQHLPIATAATTTIIHPKKLTLIPLIFLIYFEVAGGPYGEEPAVQAAGPLLAILGFLVFPFIWSIPEALITAELSTAYPGNGGFVIWAHHAFGPFFGSLMGSWKFLSGVINIAAFPALCVNYLQKLFPIFSSGLPRNLAISLSTVLLSFLNFTGLTIVGYVAVFLGIISLLPFIVMSLIAIPNIHPNKWTSFGQKGVKKDWNLFFNTLFWNLNFWDNVSTMAGEVDNPQKTFPIALFSAVILTCLAYIIPLMAVSGAVNVDQMEWESGYMANAAQTISGKWLKYWIEIGAVLSGIGLFEAQLSSSAYQLLGMADLGFLPKFFGLRSKWFNTPWVGILLATVITLGVSYMEFTDIIGAANFLYSLGMLLEFAEFPNVLTMINEPTAAAIAYGLDKKASQKGHAATTIEWTMSELLRHPQVMKKVQKELEQVVGMDRMVEESNLESLKYLDMVIKEAFRLHPVAPLLLPHESIQDCTIDGFFIPKKSRVMVNVWAIGRDPKVWTDAEKFLQKRFVESNINLRGCDFELLPFGSGRRGAPGCS